MGKNISFESLKKAREIGIAIIELSEFKDNKESLSEEEKEKVWDLSNKIDNLIEEFKMENFPDLPYDTFFEELIKILEMCQIETVE